MYRFLPGPSARPSARKLAPRRLHAHSRAYSSGESPGDPRAGAWETLHWGMEEEADRNPDRIALVHAEDGSKISYGKLNSFGAYLGSSMLSRGVSANSGRPVAVCVDTVPNGKMMIGSLLGTLKTGNPYLPVNTRHAPERLRKILRDSKATLLVTGEDPDPETRDSAERAGTIIANVSDLASDATNGGDCPAAFERLSEVRVTGESRAYVLYTSGSTGIPKGVVASHASIHNRLRWMWRTFPFGDGERAYQKTNLTFVDHAWEIFGALSAGIPLVVASGDARRDPEIMLGEISQNHVSRMVVVPSLLRALLEISGDSPGSLRKIAPEAETWITSGEPLTVELASRFLTAFGDSAGVPGDYARGEIPASHRGVLINTYGSTEVAADVSSYVVSSPKDISGLSGSLVPVGKPVANTGIHVLDPESRDPVGVGDVGEIYVTGANLAEGYLGDTKRTAESFVEIQPGIRAFKTGDFGYFQEDGNLMFVGRRDFQVKIRGQRVDLLEVEALTRTHPKVKTAAVCLSGPEGPEGVGSGVTLYYTPSWVSREDIMAFLAKSS